MADIKCSFPTSNDVSLTLTINKRISSELIKILNYVQVFQHICSGLIIYFLIHKFVEFNDCNNCADSDYISLLMVQCSSVDSVTSTIILTVGRVVARF